MSKTVLITGACGFIGRYVAKEYKQHDYQVIGMGHGRWSKEEYAMWGIDVWYSCDITIENLISYAQKPDVIVHCAGGASVGFSIEKPMLDFKRTVYTLQCVLEYIRTESKHTRLIYPSSAAVYGNIDQLPIKENVTLQPVSPYGVHKKIAEELCTSYCRQYDISAIIVRLFSVYGNGLYKQLLWDACSKLERGESVFWGTGQETRDWVHISDVAALLYLAREKAECQCEIVNCGSGKNVSVTEVLKYVFFYSGALKRPCFGGQTNIGNPQDYLANNEKILLWGWKPKMKLSEGIKNYVEWYKVNEKN